MREVDSQTFGGRRTLSSLGTLERCENGMQLAAKVVGFFRAHAEPCGEFQLIDGFTSFVECVCLQNKFVLRQLNRDHFSGHVTALASIRQVRTLAKGQPTVWNPRIRDHEISSTYGQLLG